MYRYCNSLGGPDGMGLLISLFIIVLIVTVMVLLVRMMSRPDMHHKDHDRGKPAMEILKERYAKGEITKKDYEEIKQDIQ